jgi:hypothetical protein
MTEDQFNKLPEACQQLVLIDRALDKALREPAVNLMEASKLLKMRKPWKRMAEIIVMQPRTGGAPPMAVAA